MFDPKKPRANQPSLPAGPQEQAEGTVSYVRYANEESGYRVLSVATKTGVETWVGVMPLVQKGQPVSAYGVRERDPKFGPQFRVTSLVQTIPTSLEGIEKYLGSGILPGIKEGMARRIMTTFGAGALAMLTEAPDELRKVGLSQDKIARVKAAWVEQRAIADIMVFLQCHGASPTLAHRIYKRYGARAIELVETTPYRLALEVRGVGFAIADRIAQSVGIERDSPERAQAGALHQLTTFAKSGHVYTIDTDLAGATSRALEIPYDLAAQAIRTLHSVGRVVHEDGRVYPSVLHAAEVRLAQRLRALLDAPLVKPLDEHVGPAVDEFEKTRGMSLSPEQRDALGLAARVPTLVITGGPGTGKSSQLKAILTLFQRAELSVKLAAPTGRAAKRMTETTGMNAVTLHRLLDFDPQTGVFARCRANPIPASAVIIDETSMVDTEMADRLLDAVSAGTRLVLVGDVDQLPSVGPGAVLRDVIASGVVPTVRLTKIFRQAEGSLIVQNAHRINQGVTPSGGGPGGDFLIVTCNDQEHASDLVVDIVQNCLPQQYGLDPTRDVQVLAPIYNGAAGVTALNERLQAVLNPHVRDEDELRRGATTFRLGDKVMQLKNDYDREVYNGDIGFIARVDPEERTLTVMVDGREVQYEGTDLDDLTLANAATIHKCVTPDTLIETDAGILPIEAVPTLATRVATAVGMRAFSEVHRYDSAPLMEVETEDGYRVRTTPNHGLYVWNGAYVVRREVQHLQRGDILRLRLGPSAALLGAAPLPPDPGDDGLDDFTATIPREVTHDLAELLGHMVARGTLKSRSLWLRASQKDTAERCAGLCASVFGIDPGRRKVGNGWYIDLASMRATHWLHTVGGMGKDKRVPSCIMRSPTDIQAAFLRGLCADMPTNGTVRYVTDVSPELEQQVRAMCLRLYTIVSNVPRQPGVIAIHDARVMRHNPPPADAPQSMSADDIGWHYTSVTRVSHAGTGPVMCLTVPGADRFLQNGFDGANSQGSEYPAVVIPMVLAHRIMLSRNLLYTAVTRGKQLVVLVAEPKAVALAIREVRREVRRTTLMGRLLNR